ncbi:MAG: M48 family metallopeptidase [Bryobacteraceae bacterium]
MRDEWPGVQWAGGARHDVEVTVTPRGFQIHRAADGARLWWPYEEVRPLGRRFERKGEALEIAEPGFPEALRATAPNARYYDPARLRWWPLALAAVVAGVIAAGVALYLWGLPAAADAVAARVPVAWEVSLGQAVFRSVAADKPDCAADAVAQIVATLAAALPSTPYKFQVKLSPDREINAFAAPGGFLVVQRGLLEKTRRPEELAGVLAHEIQHVVRRHSTRALVRAAGLQALLALALGDAGIVAEAAGHLGSLRYSRQAEEEADREGMKLLHAARIDASGMTAFFRILQQEVGDVSGPISYLSSHPRTEERIAALKRLEEQAGSTPVRLLPGRAWEQVVRGCP